MKRNNCLLLNISYSPIGVFDWKKSVVWAIKHNEDPEFLVEIISYSDNYLLMSNNRKFYLPSVARSKTYHNFFKRDITFSRKNLYIRDNYTCQYCCNQLPLNQLTYDHVIPKSRFKGEAKKSTNWKNIVTCCIKCNRKKGNRTPEEAGMILHNLPYIPRYSDKYLRWHTDLLNMYTDIPSEWKEFLILRNNKTNDKYLQSQSS